MKKILFGFLILPLLAAEIKLTEIKPVLDEILGYHVEENIFSPKLAKRSFKNYLNTFDPEFHYFLPTEIDEILQKDKIFWEEVVKKYEAGDFSPYQILDTIILNAITRSKKIYSQIKPSFLEKTEFKKNEIAEVSFCKSESDLATLIENELEEKFYFYLKEHDHELLSADQKIKIFEFYEKKNSEHEQVYLASKNRPLLVIKAIGASLDAHTMYYSLEEALQLRRCLSKEFCGLGIQLKESVEGPFVSNIIPNSPASASGLVKAGDRIIEIDGQKTDKINFSEVLHKLIGSPHSTVSLLTKSKEGVIARFELTRETVFLDDERVSFDYEHFGDGIIGFITLPSFYSNSGDISVESDLRQALSELKSAGKLNGLIIDIRNNSGGFLQQAVQAAGLFMQSGTVAIAKYANDEIKFTRKGDPKLFYMGPLVIMTSMASASASEVFAQALQDEGVAIVVGDRRTYGKGSMQYQTITDLNSKHFYKVTVGRYYTISGKSPQITGVKADIIVPTVYSSLHLGEKFLKYPLSLEMPDKNESVQKYLESMFSNYLIKAPSTWQKMAKTLQKNSSIRQESDRNLQLFFKQLEDENIPFKAKTAGCGSEDLQKKEAVNIIKDMIFIHSIQ